VVAGALDRGARLDAVYLGPGAARAFAPLVERLRATGTRLAELREGVLEKVGLTRTPQPVLGVTRWESAPLDALTGDGLVVVAAGVSDPGNLGTIVRSAEAAGVDGVVVCANSVDVLNPKVVRSTMGSLFGVTLAEADDPVEVLDVLGAGGRRCLGTRAGGGEPYDRADLASPCALVLGNEAHGLPPDLGARLDGEITIPLQAATESLNVAMAATVLVFEAARQRRARTAER
jgi:TrmH family RNA methyltransferase